MKKNTLEKINTSKALSWAIVAAIFLLILACNLWTALYDDDYYYMLSFADGSRIESIADIFPSMAAHRNVMNGRIVAHFFVQLSLLLPLTIFKVVNSVMFVTMLLTVYILTMGGQKKRNNLLLISIFGAVWVFMPAFGQVVLWQTGAINYLWSVVFSMLYILIFVRKFMDDKDIKNIGIKGLFVLYAFLVGAYSECSGTTIIFLSCAFMLLGKLLKKQRLPIYLYLSVAASIAGFLFMIISPGEIENKPGSLTVAGILKGLSQAAELYKLIWAVLVIYIVLAVIALYSKKVSRDRQLLAFLLALGSLAAIFVLSFAAGAPDRCGAMGTVMIIAASGVLANDLFDSKFQPVLIILSCVLLTATFYSGCVGIADIYSTNYQEEEIEKYILESKENGILDVAFYPVVYNTKYSVGYDMVMPNIYPDWWPNKYIAMYYGINSVVGIYD